MTFQTLGVTMNLAGQFLIQTFNVFFQGLQTLVSQEASIASVQEHHVTLEGSITQRLKWGAGANPSLAVIMQQFEETLNNKNALLQVC